MVVSPCASDEATLSTGAHAGTTMGKSCPAVVLDADHWGPLVFSRGMDSNQLDHCLWLHWGRKGSSVCPHCFGLPLNTIEMGLGTNQ